MDLRNDVGFYLRFLKLVILQDLLFLRKSFYKLNNFKLQSFKILTIKLNSTTESFSKLLQLISASCHHNLPASIKSSITNTNFERKHLRFFSTPQRQNPAAFHHQLGGPIRLYRVLLLQQKLLANL